MALERKYSVELKAEALAMVDALRERDPGDRSAVRATATALGVGEQSLRSWLKTREKREAQRRDCVPTTVAEKSGSDDAKTFLTQDRENELIYLRGECERLRAAIKVLISS
jgi:transposase-like protein